MHSVLIVKPLTIMQLNKSFKNLERKPQITDLENLEIENPQLNMRLQLLHQRRSREKIWQVNWDRESGISSH